MSVPQPSTLGHLGDLGAVWRIQVYHAGQYRTRDLPPPSIYIQATYIALICRWS